MLHIGFDSYVSPNRIIAIVPYGASKIKSEVIERKKNEGNGKTLLQDCTKNHVIRSVIICDDGTYILSAVSTASLAQRLQSKGDE